MTAKRDLKKRIRERQARTGERYTTARQHVVAPAPEPVPVVELVDLSAEAARLGLSCRVAVAPALAERIEAAAALERLRDALMATENDPATELMRRVLLCGEAVPVPLDWTHAEFEDGGRFIRRARAGIGGASKSGRALALPVQGKQGVEMMVCVLYPMPVPALAGRPPLLILASTTEGLLDLPGKLGAVVPRIP